MCCESRTIGNIDEHCSDESELSAVEEFELAVSVGFGRTVTWRLVESD